MRIFVTVGALVERNTHIPRLAVGSIGVALGAWNLRMHSDQRITGFGVIELSDINRLPVREVMAVLAIRAETALVLVFMARDTTRGDPQVGLAEILDLDRCSLMRRNVGGIMALGTGQACVFALEHVTCVPVTEGLDVPFDQRKVFAVVFRVAAGALLARARRNVVSRMQAFPGEEPRGNFGVAVKTFEGSLSAELVTTGAVRRSVQRLMRPGQWTGRNLPRNSHCAKQEKQHQSAHSTAAPSSPVVKTARQSRLVVHTFLARSLEGILLLAGSLFVCDDAH